MIHIVISIALRLFFRRIETVNAEAVPETGGIIFVLNHPNGLIDPALVFVSLPRRVSFLAKSTLFTIPVGGTIIRVLESLPVYRPVDAPGDTSKNLETFRAAGRMLADERAIAIFPEGISHDDTKLKPIKTGAARIALGALSVDDGTTRLKNLRIMAAGLYYTSKTAFRSEAMIRFGEIIEVTQVEPDADGEPPREAVQELTDRIEAALRRVTLNLDSGSELDSILKAEALFSSVYENLLFRGTLTHTFGRLQELAEQYRLLGENDPQRMSELRERIESYEKDLRSSGVTAESLSVLQHPTWYVFRYLVLRLAFVVLVSVPAIIGAVVHSPAYVFSNFIGLVFRTHGADTAGSTYKILAAIVLMPLTWLVTASVVWYFFDWRIALISIPVTILCGYIALRSSETLIDLSVWLRSVWLLFRQRGLFLRLLIQREALKQEIGEIIEPR